MRPTHEHITANAQGELADPELQAILKALEPTLGKLHLQIAYGNDSRVDRLLEEARDIVRGSAAQGRFLEQTLAMIPEVDCHLVNLLDEHHQITTVGEYCRTPPEILLSTVNRIGPSLLAEMNRVLFREATRRLVVAERDRDELRGQAGGAATS